MFVTRPRLMLTVGPLILTPATFVRGAGMAMPVAEPAAAAVEDELEARPILPDRRSGDVARPRPDGQGNRRAA
jgi:hypothetical protein